MPASGVNALQPEALEANRGGALSEDQLRGFRAMSRYGRRSALSTAAFLVAGAILVGFFASPTAPVATRALIVFICLAIAAFLVVRSILGTDPLTRDLRHVQVQSVEGAIGKRRVGGRTTTHFLEVGDRSFKVSSGTYDDAPDAGFVRLYFLPHSRKVVNLERLENPPLSGDLSAPKIASSIRASLSWGDRARANEARAELASAADAMKAAVVHSAAAPPTDARDQRPLEKAIVGTWKNAMMKVTFAADGTVTTNMLGAKREGHWSVDGDGRLRSDITGREGAADAWIAANELTVTIQGQGLTFTRVSGG